MSVLIGRRSAPAESTGSRFQPLRLVLIALSALLLLSVASRWYAGEVALPRYCERPEVVLQRLAAVMSETRPAGEGARGDYIVAAKLEFLVPPGADEPPEAYLQRVRRLLERQCR